jgi:hypothetical protein
VSVSPTLDAIVRDLYTAPVEDGMPSSSKLTSGFAYGQSGYYLTMHAPAFDVHSYTNISEFEVRRMSTHPGALIALLERKLGQLRQTHHFACLSRRGGYY